MRVALIGPLLALFAGAGVLAADPLLPPGAPPIASDFHSWDGVNKLRRPARHQGIDITGPAGQAVIAAADGRVLETATDRCWGPTVVIDHGHDRQGKPLIGVYGHVETFAVRTGQTVRRGQVIAALGDNHTRFDCTGDVRHLHFQLGRSWRGKAKGDYWGHLHFLRDGRSGIDPHQLWADGPNRVTCFRPGARYPTGTLTYPVPCR